MELKMPWYEITHEEDGKTLTLNVFVEASDPKAAVAKALSLAKIVRGIDYPNDGKWRAQVAPDAS